MLRGTYTGEDATLLGKTALLRESGDDLLAQFDDTETGYGFGWYRFPAADFSIDAPPGETFH